MVAVLSVFARDWNTVYAVGAGALSLSVPFILIRSGRYRAGNLVLTSVVLITVTTAVTVGQGLHDTAVVAYPIILIYVGLTSDRALLFLCAGLTIAAGLWLAVGSSLGWFVPVPVLRVPFDFFSVVTLSVLSIVAALAVDLLSSSLRRSLAQARHEIEERKKLEEQRTRLSAQLAQAQKMESVGRLAGGVAHDFNNMLAVISGYAEVALQEPGTADPVRDALEEIRKAARHSADLTRQLLAFARRQAVVPRVLDLDGAIQGTLGMLKRMIGENVDLKWQPGATWPVRVDPTQVGQVLVNLCVNARDAIHGVGTISISTGNRTLDEPFVSEHPGSCAGDFVMLVIHDDGRGMDPETASHLFEPFFTTKPIGEGTGLGLAMVYGAVKQNGGFIDVQSAPGCGTTFHIYLPRHAGEAKPADTADAAAPLRGGRETVLIVEDEPGVLKLTRSMLEPLGYTVLTSRSPNEAVRIACEQQGKVDLLVTDVVMPEMNGHELAATLRTLHPGLKCLFMSGCTGDIIADHGELDEAVSFVEKPFSAQRLAERIRRTLER
ncbi:MAG TPA: response regulator [Spirochaetia bacterium]|nr:response regulator [Spirochaetia bacterium]